MTSYLAEYDDCFCSHPKTTGSAVLFPNTPAVPLCERRDSHKTTIGQERFFCQTSLLETFYPGDYIGQNHGRDGFFYLIVLGGSTGFGMLKQVVKTGIALHKALLVLG